MKPPGELRRTTPLPRRPWLRARSRSRGPTAAVRAAVKRRDGACVAPGAFGLICGGHTELHHVETKGMGGRRTPDTADDLVALCAIHHGYVTTHPAEAIDAGLARRRNR